MANWPKWEPTLTVKVNDARLWVVIPPGKTTPDWANAYELWEKLDLEQRVSALADDVNLDSFRNSASEARSIDRRRR